MAPGAGTVDLLELVEQTGLVGGGDADATVLDLEAQIQAAALLGHLHHRQAHRTRVGELHRIGQKVEQQFGHALGVAHQPPASKP